MSYVVASQFAITLRKGRVAMSYASLFEDAYEIVSQIPEGYVMTYSQIAAILGNPRYARRIGQAMYGAPPDRNLPCHRVVHADGGLCVGTEFGQIQHELLLAEGVSFLPGKKVAKVDLILHQWMTYR